MNVRRPLVVFGVALQALVMSGCTAGATPPAPAPIVTTVVATEAPQSAPATSVPATSIPPTSVPPSPAPPTPAPLPATPTPAAQSDTTGDPVFSNPTRITNPLYPVALTARAIAIGHEGDSPARNEVTLLPTTRMIDWNGQQIEALVVQFIAFSDASLNEVAYDYFAQADNGDVYYLGEDVSNYQDGVVKDTGGSWLAGKDGAPPALIMPASPQVGQRFNPENLPGVVFEQDEVLSMNQHIVTPAGPTDAGILVKETLMDGSIEHKIYAANYGIVEDQAPDELLDLVLFVPAGAAAGNAPDALSTIEAQAEDIMDIVPSGTWSQVKQDVTAIGAAWQAYAGQASSDGVPQPLQDAFAARYDALEKASAAQDSAEALNAANQVSAALIDILEAYHPALPADLGRMDVIERQVMFDADAGDQAAAANSAAIAGAIWARFQPSIVKRYGAEAARELDDSVAAQAKAIENHDLAGAVKIATAALEQVDTLERVVSAH